MCPLLKNDTFRNISVDYFLCLFALLLKAYMKEFFGFFVSSKAPFNDKRWRESEGRVISLKAISGIKLTFISVAKVFFNFFTASSFNFSSLERWKVFLPSFVHDSLFTFSDATCEITYVILEFFPLIRNNKNHEMRTHSTFPVFYYIHKRCWRCS